MKNSLEEFNNRFELAGQKISNLNTIDLLQSEEQKERKKKE